MAVVTRPRPRRVSKWPSAATILDAGHVRLRIAPDARRARCAVPHVVIASNRGPVETVRTEEGQVVERPGSGGLVSIVAPALAAHGGTWIACAPTGDQPTAGERTVSHTPEGPITTRTFTIDAPTYRNFYQRISTETLWYLHHDLFDLSRAPSYDAEFAAAWSAYREVNQAFADACAAEARNATTIAIVLMDYHLGLAPAALRAHGVHAAIAHVILSPWAEPRRFGVLARPYARAVVDGMLGADAVVFLATRWVRNFVDCCADLGYEVVPDRSSVRAPDGRHVLVLALPVGVDPAMLRRRLRSPGAQEFGAELDRRTAGRRLVVRAERLEPAKNLLRGLHGFAEFLATDAAATGSLVHYVIAYHSRSDIPEYQRYAADVVAAVDEVNGRFGTPDWQPVILDTTNDHPRGLAAMKRADVLVVNPLWDGMNLIAKEGSVVNDRDGALVLSKNTGAAEDLGDAALLVDPLDVSGLAAAIGRGLALPPEERRHRAARLRAAALTSPPQEWFSRLIRVAESARAR